jgi:molecular chaperone DnaK
MARRRDPVLGIDLGTTYSVVAVLDPTGAPVTIPNRDGDLSTPSVVLFEDDAVIVGKEAQRLALVEPDRVADCAKRDMGAPFYHRPISGRQVSPQMISAIILKRLKADAERRLGPIGRAVITVPAYFDHSRREATAEAGRLAGLEVVDILNEPTAAALAYGFQEGFLDAAGALDGRQTARKGVLTVLVYDLGGGTFDVTVMQIRDRNFKTLVTDGDVRLGGRDWDQRIVDHAAERFLAEHPGDDPRQSSETLQALLQETEGVKRTLSERAKTKLTFTHNGRRLSLELSRPEFEHLTADLLDRTRVTTKLVLHEAGLEWSDVDKVLLSGGSTRMPQVSRMLRELSGKQPDRSISPDEAVAHGAALYHGILAAGGDSETTAPGARPTVVDVNAHSLGVIAMSRSRSRYYNSILIPRNTPLPHSGSQGYQTVKPGQRRVVIRVVEGEALDPADCIPLGEFVIEPLPPNLPQGSPVRVSYSYDRSGRIKVEAMSEADRTRAEVRIVRRPTAVARDHEDWALKLLHQPEDDEMDSG